LYAFSPAGITTETEFLSRYPGNDWVDVVGFDNYCGSDKSSIEKYKKDVTAGLQVVTNYAKLNNKIPVLAETGMESIPVADYFTNILLPTIEPFNISYVLLWRNAFDKPNHFYAPYPGHTSADDFKKFTGSKRMVMSNNMPSMYAPVKSQKSVVRN
jgi:beta-mannanase